MFSRSYFSPSYFSRGYFGDRASSVDVSITFAAGASTNVVAQRVRFAGSLIESQSSASISAYKLKDFSLVISADSQAVINGQKVKGSALISASFASLITDPERVRQSTAVATAQSTITSQAVCDLVGTVNITPVTNSNFSANVTAIGHIGIAATSSVGTIGSLLWGDNAELILDWGDTVNATNAFALTADSVSTYTELSAPDNSYSVLEVSLSEYEDKAKPLNNYLIINNSPNSWEAA